VLPEKHAILFQEKITLARDKKTIEIFEYDLDIADIGKLSFEARLVGMDNSSVLCIVRDITSERENILELKNSREALRDANISKDKFFSIIAHDLKNPFNALIGFSSLLNEDFQEFTDEERMEYIKQIYQASESLFSLLENLLEWTKAQTGKLEFSPEVLDINAIIDQNLKILTPEARQKNIELVFDDAASEDCYVRADKNMLTSIIRNLTANAIKFTHPGGRIVISIKEGTSMVTCAVTDNGVGISEEDLNKLFKIDSNVRKAGTENEQGTGLGLLLCKEFVEKNGGKISVDSQESKGSTFSFTVPRAR
jgi:signal transduction histidine kinase